MALSSSQSTFGVKDTQLVLLIEIWLEDLFDVLQELPKDQQGGEHLWEMQKGKTHAKCLAEDTREMGEMDNVVETSYITESK